MLVVDHRHGRADPGWEPAYAAFALARDVPEVIAVGVNCLDPDDVPGLLALAAEASGKPGVAYPNRGEGWDATAKSWTGPGAFDPTAASGWVAAGARLVGGCCRVTPADIRAIHRTGRAADHQGRPSLATVESWTGDRGRTGSIGPSTARR